MLFCRLYENAVASLWRDGLISGEMHLGSGEEAIVAGIAAHLQPEDALALDHRPTAAALLHGVDPAALLHECLGHPQGLGKGQGGHMHIFSKQHQTASSGIVGASGPAGAGFGLAAKYLRPGSVAVSYFGDGAINQGMLMESFNLAITWQLPVIFVCKDDHWAITTTTDDTSPVSPAERARGFGLPVFLADGNDVENVYQAAGKAIAHARKGNGPVFIHANCHHLEGHMVELQLVRLGRNFFKGVLPVLKPILRALLSLKGAPWRQRWQAVRHIFSTIFRSGKDHRVQNLDPVALLRDKLAGDPSRLQAIETETTQKIEQILKTVLPAAGEEAVP
jgi:pyruvate dehydrogenase E1 component alpha subunit